MRQFNRVQKIFLKNFVKTGQPYFALEDVISSLGDIAVYLSMDKVLVYRPKTAVLDKVQNKKKAEKQFWRYITIENVVADALISVWHLMKYLKENDLISEIDEKNDFHDDRFGNIDQMESETSESVHTKMNLRLIEDIHIDVFATYYISEDLPLFVKDKFQDAEDKRFSANQWTTWIGIIVSLLLSTLSLIWSIFYQSK